MTPFGQSALLQALGWATLNSFWQVGLLWCCFTMLRRYIRLSPERQYGFAVGALGISLLSFFLSLWFYLLPGAEQTLAVRLLSSKGEAWLPMLLTAASVSYLLLLFIPAGRLVYNWRFLKRLRKEGLHKAPVQHRVFVQKISGHLGLRKPVRVQLSALVNSPVTIGYLKPLILLPIASFNQLTVRQAEAILLHELAHIRRFDFLVNIGITLTQTILYFNPFVRLFVQAAEASREESCDSLVLRFGYDRIAYASALLQLEKSAAPVTQLALAATGKNQLLGRIQAILGQERGKPVLRLQHFTGMLTSLLCVLALHSLFISGQQKAGNDPLHTLTQLANPFALAFAEETSIESTSTNTITTAHAVVAIIETTPEKPDIPAAPPEPGPEPWPAIETMTYEPAHIIQVANTETTQLAAAERQKVNEVMNTTQKILSQLEWKQLEKEIGDGLTEAEKAQVYEQFQEEVKNINWEKMEQNLMQNYHNTDWEKVNHYLAAASEQLKLDSMANAYGAILIQLETMRQDAIELPLPDLTTGEIETLKVELRKLRDSIYTVSERPVIRL